MIMSNTEQTLSIIKPDAVDRNLDNEIKEMFKNKGFLIVTGSTTASFFGNTTTIGDTTAQHISIAPDSLSIKTADDITVLSASAAGIVMTGSITATEGTIGGFTLGSTSLIAGDGTTRVSLDTANGIHLGNNTFGSAPFRVTRAGALTATSVAITGEVNASSGTTAEAITKVGVITGSLITSSSLASSSLESVKLTTGSLNDASSSLSVASSSLSAGSGSIATRVKIETTGISVDNASGTSLASLTNSLRVGVVGDNKSRLEIDSDGNLEIINRQGSTDTTVISLDKDGDATFAGALSAATGTFSGQLVIGGSNTSLTTADLAASLATEISGSSLSGSNSATATGEASVSASTSATATGEQGIADAATAQAAVDTIEGKVVIGGSSVSVQQNSSNKAVLTTSGVELFQGGTSVSNFGSSVRIGPDANSKSRVEISSGADQIINKDGSGNETTMLNFKNDGDIESGDFLIERSRLFGAGNDGDIVLKSNDCTVSGGQGSAARASDTSIKDENDDVVCSRSGAVWTMQGDWYTKSLEVDTSVAATTLITNGFRLFVQGTLTIDANCIVHNDGTAGGNGTNGDTSSQKTGGTSGAGGVGNSLSAGPAGGAGGNGGNAGQAGYQYGGSGGAGGGAGGIVFIAARTIVNNGTIRSHGGNGGTGGDGAGNASAGFGQSVAAAGGAGAAGSVIHIKV